MWDGFSVGNLADLVCVRVLERARLRFFLFVSLVLDSGVILIFCCPRLYRRNTADLGVLGVVAVMETFVFTEIDYLSIDPLESLRLEVYGRL